MSFPSLFRDVISRSSATIPETWLQGRTAFGGLSIALLQEHLKHAASPTTSPPQLRSLQASFVGPIFANSPLTFTSSTLRRGKNVTQVKGEIVQDDEVKLVAFASFGNARKSSINVNDKLDIDSKFPEVTSTSAADIDALPPRGLQKGLAPIFTHNYDFRMFTPVPYCNTDERTMRGMIKYREVDDNEDCSPTSKVLGLSDAWPPVTLPMLKEPAPGASLTMSIDIVKDITPEDVNTYCFHEGVVHSSADGYASQTERLWNLKGDLLCISNQNIVHFG